MLENTEGAIKKGQSRENLEKHITICAGHYHTKHTNNVIMACAFLQTTGEKNEPNIAN
jgi:hypothetical protein